MSNLINRMLHYFGYYKIEELQSWGHCGCCGVPLNKILPKEWAWGICDKCSCIESNFDKRERNN